METQISHRYSHTVGFMSLIGRGFNHPVDVALSRDGILYVLNRAGPEVPVRMPYKRVTMCTVTEEYLGEFSSGGTADGQMTWPASIALDSEGNVYVSDEALHRISIFDSWGRFLSKWGIKGKGEGEFDRPTGIAFDHDDNLLVVDSLNNRIQRFTRDGKFLGDWGSGGDGDGEFNIPWGITVDAAENIYVVDWRNDRIQKFDPDGKHLATLGSSGGGDGEFNRPSGVSVDREGNMYVADWGNERVQVIDENGGYVDKMRGDAGLSKWGEDYFQSNLDELEERQKADMEPPLDLAPYDQLREESGSIEKLFWGPTAVKLDDQGRVYIVDSCRQRIQIYQREGG